MANIRQYLKVNDKYRYENSEMGTILFMDEVAICFDRDNYLLLDHGKPEDVIEFYKDILDPFDNARWDILSEDVVVISAKFPVKELNKLIVNPSYMSNFVENNKDLLSRDIDKKWTRKD